MTDDRTPNGTDPDTNGPDTNGPAMADGDILAAELALGLLEGEHRATALRRVLAEPDFAAAVERWRAHFAMLFDESPAVAAPAGGLPRLLGALGNDTNDNRPIQPLPGRQPASVRLWQGVAAFSSLAAAVLLVMVSTQPKPLPNTAPVTVATVAPPLAQALLVTQITVTDGSAPVAAVFDPNTGELRIAPATLVDQRHSAELWVIAADGVPHSLGVLASGKRATLVITPTDRNRMMAGSVLAVTVEPPGGSPDGKPTGAIVAKGALSII